MSKNCCIANRQAEVEEMPPSKKERMASRATGSNEETVRTITLQRNQTKRGTRGDNVAPESCNDLDDAVSRCLSRGRVSDWRHGCDGLHRGREVNQENKGFEIPKSVPAPVPKPVG